LNPSVIFDKIGHIAITSLLDPILLFGYHLPAVTVEHKNLEIVVIFCEDCVKNPESTLPWDSTMRLDKDYATQMLKKHLEQDGCLNHKVRVFSQDEWEKLDKTERKKFLRAKEISAGR
jgi:hypothetical protein